MNIVWIEDFGGQKASGRYLAAQLFQSLAPTDAVQMTDWPPMQLKCTPELLSKYFFENAPEHQVKLLTNVNAYLDDYADVDVVRDVDLFVLDIKLTKDDQPEGSLGKPNGFSDVPDFHSRAGLYIYSHLLARRFPKSRICLMTGETTGADFVKAIHDAKDEFKKLCTLSLVDEPKTFSKEHLGHCGDSDFHRWLREIVVDASYLRFRRGALDGIQYTRQLLAHPKTTKEVLHFSNYLHSSHKKDISFVSARTYLDGLEVLLPAEIPATGAGESSILRLFLRALVHDWENRAKADRRQAGREKLPSASSGAGFVLKLVRNCVTHSRLLDDVTSRDLAILFILDFRVMFGRQDGELRSYERNLLNMFEPNEHPDLDIEKTFFELKSNLYDHLSSSSKFGDKNLLNNEPLRLEIITKDNAGNESRRPLCFSEIVNELSLSVPASNLSFRILVIQAFWLYLFEVKEQRHLSKAPEADWVAHFHRQAFSHYFGAST